MTRFTDVICPIKSVGTLAAGNGEALCTQDCAWYGEACCTCAISMLGEACSAAIGAEGGAFTGPDPRAGIIVKHAPLEDDFIKDSADAK